MLIFGKRKIREKKNDLKTKERKMLAQHPVEKGGSACWKLSRENWLYGAADGTDQAAPLLARHPNARQPVL